MGENIDPTWLACASRAPLHSGWLDERLARVERHYSQLVDYRVTSSRALAGHCAVATVGDAEPRCRWAHFSQDAGLAVATAYVPGGWSKVAGELLSEAPAALGRAIQRDPASVIPALSPPVAAAVLDRASGELTVINDAIGAARAFTLEMDGLWLCSNRPGALTILAGVDARPDEEGWLVQAGAGWPLGRSSPLAGVRRLGPGVICTADANGKVHVQATNALATIVRPADPWRELAGPAAEQMVSRASEAAMLWPEQADVDLSGGRDSRVTAAATIAAGIDARYLTSNATPGEGRVARGLMERIGREEDHRVRRRKSGSATPDTPLLERAANLHLLHDGVRHAQKLRGKMTLPRPRPERAKFSGHGGEIAHGFFYGSRAEIRRLRLRPNGVEARLDRFFAQGHDGARPAASEAARAAVEAALAEGRELGLRGPVLLDWFYLVDRFAHRSGVGTDSERTVLFAAPAAIRAAFAMKPRERVEARLHDRLTSEFVPDWKGVAYFQATERRVARSKRERLWEVEGDRAIVEEVLAAGGAWTDLYDRDEAVREWRALRSGNGNRKAEALFEGIVYRATFDAHLERLSRAARA